MSTTWVVAPTCLPIVLRRCGDAIKLAVRPELLNLLHAGGHVPGQAAVLLPGPVLRRHELGLPVRSDRPAWQSPYGPPSHRAHRGRWAPVPGVANPRSSLPREYLCGRCD